MEIGRWARHHSLLSKITYLGTCSTDSIQIGQMTFLQYFHIPEIEKIVIQPSHLILSHSCIQIKHQLIYRYKNVARIIPLKCTLWPKILQIEPKLFRPVGPSAYSGLLTENISPFVRYIIDVRRQCFPDYSMSECQKCVQSGQYLP